MVADCQRRTPAATRETVEQRTGTIVTSTALLAYACSDQGATDRKGASIKRGDETPGLVPTRGQRLRRGELSFLGAPALGFGHLLGSSDRLGRLGSRI
jgi:hypothetical protein